MAKYLEAADLDEKTNERLRQLLERSRATYWKQKRIFDVTVASFLLLLLLPLFVVISVAICIDDPGQLGAELLCAGVAALDLAPGPVILLCADTALSLMGIDEKGRLLGGMILPGPKAALNALVKGTAQLPQVDLDAPRAALAPLAKNSAACLQAGSILGTAAMLDGLIARLKGELGENAWVAATGELPEAVLKAMGQPVRRCEDLILDGMNLIWLKNQK